MYLMHKNNIVADIELFDNKPYKVNSVFLPEEMPYGLKGDLDFASMNIMRWHSKRTIPIGRININEIESKLGNVDDLAIKSYGLSLTDCYWYRENDSNLNWESINFFTNGFSPDLLLLRKNLLDRQRLSPDYTTNGCLDKFWILQGQTPYLIKTGGFNPGDRILAANEVVAYKIANRMHLPAVPYEKLEIDDEMFCACPSFIKNDQEEFVSLSQIEMQIDAHGDNFLVREWMQQRDEKLSNYLDDLACFNILIHNHDNHLDNCGFIVNSDNPNEILKACPLFDNGNSLNWHNCTIGLDNMRPFETSLEDYASQISSWRELPNITVLENIIKSTYKDFNIHESQIEIAIKEIHNSYNILEERFLEIEELNKDGFDPADED